MGKYMNSDLIDKTKEEIMRNQFYIEMYEKLYGLAVNDIQSNNMVLEISDGFLQAKISLVEKNAILMELMTELGDLKINTEANTKEIEKIKERINEIETRISNLESI